MRPVTAILSVAAIVLLTAGLIAQVKPSFAGEWKMAGDHVGPEGDLTITQNAATMTLEGGSQTPAPAKLTYRLDGSVSKNIVAARAGGTPTEQISKAMWVGNTLVVSTATTAGEEKRTFAIDGGDLVIEISAPARAGRAPTVTKVTFRTRIPGFGG